MDKNVSVKQKEVLSILSFYLLEVFYLLCLHAIPKKKTKSLKTNQASDPLENCSLIIPFRNESKHLGRLLESIGQLDFPNDQLEIILVDDHSLDSGPQIAKKKLEDIPFSTRLLQLDQNKGKKAALAEGIKMAKGKLIITTDADCVLPPTWLKSMVEEFQRTNSVMLCGPVLLEGPNDLIGSFQKIEQAILMKLTELYIRANRPIMANAANMMFRKEAFQKEYLNEQSSASGDDIFLLHILKQVYPGRIHFNSSVEAIVRTNCESSLSTFLSQRIRWASKAKYYKDSDTLTVGFAFSMMNIATLFLFVGSFVPLIGWSLFVQFFLLKLIFDLSLLFRARAYLNAKNQWLNVPIYAIVYPIYSIGIALLSLLYKPRWKGRSI